MNLILRENRLICSAPPAKFPHLLDRFLGCKIMHPQKNKKEIMRVLMFLFMFLRLPVNSEVQKIFYLPIMIKRFGRQRCQYIYI